MNAVDRVVRAAVFRLFVAGIEGPTTAELSQELGLDTGPVTDSLHRLADEHRLVLSAEGNRVVMAHPFSGVPTDYESQIGERSWWANCGWDAFAILALLGDGDVVARTHDDATVRWSVEDGVVNPDGLVHFVVPPSRFWDDIGFT